MSNKKLFIAGNWKMNGSIEFTQDLLSYLLKQTAASKNDIVVFPPYVFLSAANKLIANSQIKLGAQDVSAHEAGAYTGEISPGMLNNVGCNYVLIGHSERRAYHHEEDTLLLTKCLNAHQQGLTPILCIGETQSERDNNQTYLVINKQLNLILNSNILAHCILAYEPVWAIGTGKTATPAQAQEVHQFIRQQITKTSPHNDPPLNHNHYHHKTP